MSRTYNVARITYSQLQQGVIRTTLYEIPQPEVAHA